MYYPQGSRCEGERLNLMLQFDNKFRSIGHNIIAGIDEAGRGPLAGPVVASAVILPDKCRLLGINDSKKLTEIKRERLFPQILENAVAIGVGIVDEQVIDEINILQATIQAMRKAIETLKINPDCILVDALVIPDIGIEQVAIEKGDSLSMSVATASIVAKVTRDRLMVKYDKKYPQYNFAKHKGYGTKEHIEAISKFGPCEIHRRTFKRVKEYIAD